MWRERLYEIIYVNSDLQHKGVSLIDGNDDSWCDYITNCK